jgi:glycosyl hydrolase family 20/cellulose/xylan binding protein with CBM9 domain
MSHLPRLIPEPASIAWREGAFLLDEETVIAPGEGCEETASFLASVLRAATGFPLAEDQGRSQNAIALELVPGLAPGGYHLEVSSERIAVHASGSDGLFDGCRALRQLLPPEIESSAQVTGVAWTVPGVMIEDQPRYAWRGLMLDPARGFLPVDVVKSVIDLMALYGMNRLHLHLADDQGWRLAIPAYPELTRDREHYTHTDVRELVAYAQERHIMVIPEIDMPGHTTAAMIAYPALSCRGEPIAPPKGSGNYADIFCPGNDDLFDFVAEVLSECARLFPGPFLHIGGDEVVKTNWRTCPKCQQRMATEGLEDLKALEHYFLSRVEAIIQGLGKRMIGWDEVLELDAEGIGHEVAVTYPNTHEEDRRRPDTVIHSWRDPSGVEAAARLGHAVIASNQAGVYLNYAPRRLPLDRVYAYDPVPNGLSADHAERILGVEACLWGGMLDTVKRERQLLPRLCAVAERAWSGSETRDFTDFRNRLIRHRRRWDRMGLSSHPVDWVEVTYAHPACIGDPVESFELHFSIRNRGDETCHVLGRPADGAGVDMKPAIIDRAVAPGETIACSAVFEKEGGWRLDNPAPFQMDWESAYDDVTNRWSLRVAPEQQFVCPTAAPDGSETFWDERMKFQAGPDARFGLCRDDTHIYLRLHVAKEQLFTDPARQPFEQDGVEIRFDGRGDKERFFSDGEFEFSDIVPICVSPGAPGEPHGALFRRDSLPEGTRVTCVPVEGGYQTDVAIPTQWDVFRVNVCVNLADGETVAKRSWRPPWRSADSFPWSGTFYRPHT